MEHVIGSGDSSEKENIAVRDAPIAEDPHHTRSFSNPRPPKRLIEEANIVAYALSVAEETEGGYHRDSIFTKESRSCNTVQHQSHLLAYKNPE